MGFLDNSGDIILDAVLTDTGRMRLAKGDGSFKITKFAFGDDEINYNLYDKNHASGSAYYDIEILQSPVLEAFTNNASSMKSKLISIPRTNLLYLPVMKLQTTDPNYQKDQASSLDTFLVSVDTNSNTDDVGGVQLVSKSGVLNGVSGGGASKIQVQQGLDTSDISSTFTIDPDLNETQFILEIDNRLGMISHGGTTAAVSFIDDDNLASYFLSSNPYVTNNAGAGTDIASGSKASTTTGQSSAYSMAIAGPRGNVLEFQIKASLDLNSSTALFTKLGGTYTIDGQSFYFIDTTVRVTGATTGYRLDVPVRFVKKV
tara:strand:- start:4644 stop:5591 length:948 start_codon:yes stop_codon:yes gene_type:complete